MKIKKIIFKFKDNHIIILKEKKEIDRYNDFLTEILDYDGYCSNTKNEYYNKLLFYTVMYKPICRNNCSKCKYFINIKDILLKS